jgi:hypothetical protein
MPLRRPVPPASFPPGGLARFADDLQDYFEEINDPLWNILVHGEQVWQQVFTLTLLPIKNGVHPRDAATDEVWRILAGDADHMVSAEISQNAAAPGGWEITEVSTGLGLNEILAAAKSIDALAAAQVGANLDNYELRVLRIPALSIEALWLAYLPDKASDRVIPYHARGGMIPTAVMPMNDFLLQIRLIAEKRIAYQNVYDRPQV